MENTTTIRSKDEYALATAIEKLLTTAGLRGSHPEVSFRGEHPSGGLMVICSYALADGQRMEGSRVFLTSPILEVERLERTVAEQPLASRADASQGNPRP